jgi:hypothetical protein
MIDTSTTFISHKYPFEELAMIESEIGMTDTDSECDVVQRPSAGQLGTWKTNENGSVQHIIEIPHRADNLEHTDLGICWFNPPDIEWSPSFYLSERGLDNLHIYLWITKDFCWVQSWLIPGLIIGSLACLYALFLSFRAAYWRRNLGEFWIKLAEFMWLFANFWWMVGELHDDHYGYFDDGANSIVDKHTKEAGVIFICTLVWISLYYIILKPMNLLEESKEEEVRAAHDPTALQPRFSFFFKTWNEYENIHVFFWVGKDTAWNWWIQSMWLVFFIPTLLIGWDFVYMTLRSKRLMIDHAHYFAQLMWVIANAVWAGGEFWFTPNNDSAIPVSRFSAEARHTSRWYSSWVVLGAYLPLIALYVLWMYYTYYGGIPPMHTCTKDMKKNTAAAASSSSSSSPRGGDVMYESGDSQHSSAALSSAVESHDDSRMVMNPLVPVRQVSVQPTPDTSYSSSKDSFKISTTNASNQDSSRAHEGHSNSISGTGTGGGSGGFGKSEVRLSDLSESNSVIQGAEV